MTTRTWFRGLASTGLGLVTMAGLAVAQDPEPAGRPAPAPARGADAGQDSPGPIDSLQDLQDTGKMLFKLADTNNDGQISQKEAIDTGNVMVGGFFFRADANGDGVVSQEEGRQARDSMMQQKPLLRMIMRRAKGPDNAEGNRGGSNPAQGLASLLDGNGDKKLQASELRQAVQTGVQGLFASADTNRDGQMTPSEVNAAIVGMANSAAQAAFQAADSDHNGALSQAEFDKAAQGPIHTIFRIVDANADNQITPQEAQTARQMMINRIQQMQVPEPANAPTRVLGTATSPRESAPVPDSPAPAPRSGRTAPIPAPGTEAVQPPQ